MKYRKKEKGFSIALLVGLIVLLGVIGYLGSTIYTSIIGGNQRTNLVTQSGQYLTQAAYILTTETTKNASGIPVASAILSNGFSPNGGGIIPTASAAPKLDSYGSPLGYCINAAVAQADPVFAIISAGPNKTFNTTCAQALAGTTIGDDKVVTKSVSNILQGVGGTVYFGDPVATVADLANLTAASIRPGQLRTVLADGSIYINQTGAVGASNWVKAGAAGGSGGSGGGGPTVMYLDGVPNYNNGNNNTAAACPSGWNETDYKLSNATSSSTTLFTYTRTCYIAQTVSSGGAGSSVAGHYRFQVQLPASVNATNYPNITFPVWFIGDGNYNSTNNTFSGTIKCDSYANCGQSTNLYMVASNNNMGANVFALTYANGNITGNNVNNYGAFAMVSEVPLVGGTVTKVW